MIDPSYTFLTLFFYVSTGSGAHIIFPFHTTVGEVTNLCWTAYIVDHVFPPSSDHFNKFPHLTSFIREGGGWGGGGFPF